MKRLTFHSIDSDANEWISSKQNNSEFDYWLLIKLIDFHVQCGDKSDDRYYVSIQAIAPSLLTEAQVNNIAKCNGLSVDDLIGQETERLISDINSYGFGATLWEETGNNKQKLIALAKEQAQSIPMLFGFYMDKPQNMLGATGWDFIKGNCFPDGWGKQFQSNHKGNCA